MRKLALLAGVIGLCLVIMRCSEGDDQQANLWRAPDTASIPHDEEGDLIRYGRALVVHTSHYLGPKGIVLHVSNGMNCENCHLDAGAKPWGSNFSAVAANYPKYHPRSNTIQTIQRKINDCFERSLNGQSLDTASKEMRAIVAYIRWLGKAVPKGTMPEGAGIRQLKFLNRPADPGNGRLIYMRKCAVCHTENGEGMWSEAEGRYIFPPLWGPQSYNNAASMFRLTKFAGYVSDNMPFNSQQHLKEEDCWDVAAYVNSQPRPAKDVSKDWPLAARKPFDYPFGPYADSFSEQRHKFGPFLPSK